MKPLRTRLQEARMRLGVPWEVLERDYLLSWILAGIGQVGSLQDTLVFKGGTALKKCYFGDYRFSEDLDFSGLEGVPTGDAMEGAVREACDAASKLLDEYAPVEISSERYTEKDPHPGGQEAFTFVRQEAPHFRAGRDRRGVGLPAWMFPWLCICTTGPPRRKICVCLVPQLPAMP